jgi:hypothetical protein
MTDFQPRRPRLRLDADSYRKLRAEVLKRDGWRCQTCGSSDDLQEGHKRDKQADMLGRQSLPSGFLVISGRLLG